MIQDLYVFSQLALISVLWVILIQIFSRKFLDTKNEEISLKSISKKILLITIQVFLFYVIWFVLSNLFGFIQWSTYYKSLDFHHWWLHNIEEGPSVVLGALIVTMCFLLSFFIVKKLNIKL